MIGRERRAYLSLQMALGLTNCTNGRFIRPMSFGAKFGNSAVLLASKASVRFLKQRSQMIYRRNL
jgi:hypothetical protein